MKIGDFIEDGPNQYGIVLSCGQVSFDVVWVGGSTTRYRHATRHPKILHASDLDTFTRDHLKREAKEARAERARGAGLRRGQVSPSR